MEDFNQWIGQLLAKTDIVSLVQKYVSLEKKGATYWACCPFHHEKTPSFSVSPVKQMYYCFGCQKGGNAITFLSAIESIDNYDAIKMLAEEARMELPQRGLQQHHDTQKQKEKRIRLLQLLKDCARHYHANLSLSKSAQDYLKKRGISQSLIKRFGIGYSLGYNHAIDYLESKGYTKQEMLEAGIAAQKADRYYDTLFERLIIPIIDIKGDVVAFGGRLLTQSDFAKYKNTSNNIVFNKSKNLFAVNLVKKKKQASGINNIIITEGYMDVISLFSAGFENVVASMGTALTFDQARIIKNLTSTVYISYDGDTAGQNATLRGLDILASAGLVVKVIALPEGLDPDDVIKQRGREFYQNLINNALPLTSFKIQNAKRGKDLTNPEDKAAFAVEAVRIIRRLDNPVEREEYLKLVKEATGYSMQVLYKQADLPADEEQAPPPPPPSISIEHNQETSSPAIIEARRFILSQIIAARPYASLFEDIYSLLDQPDLQRIYVIAAEAMLKENYTPAALYSLIEENDEETLSELVSYESIEGDGAEKYHGCIKLLRLHELEKQKTAVLAEYKQTNDKELLIKLKDIQTQITLLKRE